MASPVPNLDPMGRDIGFDWEGQRAADLEKEFGIEGLDHIADLEKEYDDPDDAVRAYRKILRARGEGEPI